MRKLVKTKDRYLTFWGFAKKMKKVFTPPQISFWGLMRINESLGLTYLGKQKGIDTYQVDDAFLPKQYITLLIFSKRIQTV